MNFNDSPPVYKYKNDFVKNEVYHTIDNRKDDKKPHLLQPRVVKLLLLV